MRKHVKLSVLRVLRALGLFHVARWLTRHRLRILCYHGYSVGDQHEFDHLLFMRAETFEKRLAALRRMRIPVVSLQEGISALYGGKVANAETVITIDDGWKTTLTQAAPLLQKFGMPATLYLTSYYCERDADLFNVVIRYMLWKSRLDSVRIEGVHPEIDGEYSLRGNRDDVARRWIAAGERHFDWKGRQQLLTPLARALGLDPEEVLRGERFRLITPEDAQPLLKAGIDIQLHTHTHRLPADDFERARAEIVNNKTRIDAWTGGNTTHFCYPSGQYASHHPDWLQRLGLASATTCDTGLNSPAQSPFLLKRFLDGEAVHPIEFDAEICGVNEILRAVKRTMGHLLRPGRARLATH